MYFVDETNPFGSSTILNRFISCNPEPLYGLPHVDIKDVPDNWFSEIYRPFPEVSLYVDRTANFIQLEVTSMNNRVSLYRTICKSFSSFLIDDYEAT